MIAPIDISIVVQGNVRPNTHRVLAAARHLFPGAQIVLSTFRTEADDHVTRLYPLFDALVVSEDPGAQPSTVRSPTAGPNNLNRQLVTTQAGLAAATRLYALKLRSDSEIGSRELVDLWEGQSRRDGHEERLLFPSLYTRHPNGINGYPFHVSDWLTFGSTDQVRAYWEAPLMPLEVATWFEHRKHGCEATATAERFRALMTQEQWICTAYAGKRGFDVPVHLHDDEPEVVRSYSRFLATHCLIADVERIGLTVPGHAHAVDSRFQRIDCVSHADWVRIHEGVHGGRPTSELGRQLARWARRPILRGLLVRKWIASRIARMRTSRQQPVGIQC